MTYTFKDLYSFSEGYIADLCKESGDDIFVPVTRLIRELTRNVDWLHEIKVYPVKNTKEDDRVWGMYERIADQDAQYEPENSEIVYIAHGDWQNRCHKRFVCSKEILHVFDERSALASTSRHYSLLTKEIEDHQSIETRPLERSPQMNAEILAQWRAMLLLCPKPERDKIISDIDGNDYYWAYKYAIPEGLIATIRSDSYEMAYDDLILN